MMQWQHSHFVHILYRIHTWIYLSRTVSSDIFQLLSHMSGEEKEKAKRLHHSPVTVRHSQRILYFHPSQKVNLQTSTGRKIKLILSGVN